MTDDDQPMTERGATVLGFLETESVASPVPRDLLEALSRQVLVAVLASPPPASLPPADVSEVLPDGRTVLALAFERSAPGRARTFLQALARDLSPEARVAVAAGAGTITRDVVLGAVPDMAAALFARQSAAGLYVEAGARALVVGPLESVGRDFRVALARGRPGPRRLWATLALGTGVALAASLPIFLRVEPPHATIHVLSQFGPAHPERGVPNGGERPSLVAGDTVDVTVLAPSGTYVTILALDSDGRLVLPGAAASLVDSTQTNMHRAWTLDAVPGEEQVLAVVSRFPLGDATPLVDTAERAPNGDRAVRIKALDAALCDRLGKGTYTLLQGQPINHVATP